MKGVSKTYKGAISLGAGAFLSKILGAGYRIFLTAIIGGYGLGLYQMIFPLYTLLLDFSGAGVPSALSKIISGKAEKDRATLAKEYLSVAVKILSIFGSVFTVLMIILSGVFSRAQGNIDARVGYVFLSPSVFLVAIISCFRGYFQGQMNMTPTAISQVIEQSVKLFLGLIFAYLMRFNVAMAVAGATFAITLSELIALIYLYAVYKRQNKGEKLKNYYQKELFVLRAKEIIKVTLPITLIGIMIPLSHVIDSLVIVNVLSLHEQNPTALYGLLSGVVHTVIGLPVAVCYGISTVSIPSVSSVKTLREKLDKAKDGMLLTTAIAFPCFLIALLFAPQIISILFRNLSEVEKRVSVSLLRITSPCILLLSLVQTTNAVLIGKNKYYLPLISMGIGIIVKTVTEITLMSVPKISVYGGGIAVIACYFCVCLINLIMIFFKGSNRESKNAISRQYAS